jgi:UDP-N-acetylglucosamine 2-epimerase (non-hydrolysing)
MKRILLVAGARPNFMKVAPIMWEMAKSPLEFEPVLIHTGQHYDANMSQVFFDELGLPPPHENLGVGSGSHTWQTAQVMVRFEPILLKYKPDWVIVVGDVNSTLACALVCSKLGTRVAHVEAGLRSFDRTMPEEINRLLTDAIADLLFVTEESGRENLCREGIIPDKIHFVGNVMIDTLKLLRPRWEGSSIFRRLGLNPATPHAVLTLHRPSNVDDPRVLTDLLNALHELSCHLPIIFPVHPRVKPDLLSQGHLVWSRLDSGGSIPSKGLVGLDPLGYLDFIALMSRARLVLTDSGGIQEETTILGVPCLTLRETTERPVTVTHGTNRVIGTDPKRIVDETLWTLAQPPRPIGSPPLWDGQAAARIVKILLDGSG